jgi:hypothetical protein
MTRDPSNAATANSIASNAASTASGTVLGSDGAAAAAASTKKLRRIDDRRGIRSTEGRRGNSNTAHLELEGPIGAAPTAHAPVDSDVAMR